MFMAPTIKLRGRVRMLVYKAIGPVGPLGSCGVLARMAAAQPLGFLV
jgi:hypothetical protein